MKKVCTLFIAGTLGFFIATGFAMAIEKGPEEIILRSTVDPAKKAKLAFFPHSLHQDNFECGKCHHTKGDDGKQVAYSEEMQIQKCETCHNKASAMVAKLSTFKNAAHQLCKGCHTERKKEGKKTGPTKCNGCHRKDLK